MADRILREDSESVEGREGNERSHGYLYNRYACVTKFPRANAGIMKTADVHFPAAAVKRFGGFRKLPLAASWPELPSG
jgi:hypothetical protein